jgi:hypothetical protein
MARPYSEDLQEMSPALGPTQPSIQWLPGTVSRGINWPGREADRSPPSSAEAVPHTRLHGLDNFVRSGAPGHGPQIMSHLSDVGAVMTSFISDLIPRIHACSSLSTSMSRFV